MQKYCLRFAGLFLLLTTTLFGQVDPDKRELIEVGDQQSLHGSAPFMPYGFYYLNEPNFYHTNITLRLAFAGVYLDSEAGFVGLLGPNTDLGVGLAGGAFGDNYYEYRQGKYYPSQSFFGHDGEGSVSVYHLFNPGQKLPVYGVARIREHYSLYGGNDTDPRFKLPNDHAMTAWRVGIRAGGREPILRPELAGELSVWYEGQHRTDASSYGYDGDRVYNSDSQLFWGRALLVYTMDNKQAFDFSVTAGTSVSADRFSAYRLGGEMPMISEFPLSIPGYFYQELSARDFVCANFQYTVPLDANKQWSILPTAAVAEVGYLPEMGQSGDFNSGVGLYVGYTTRDKVWQVLAGYGYGFEAIRDGGRGGQAISFQLQIDLEAKHPRRPQYA